MQGLKNLFLPKFEQLSSDIHTVQTNVQNRFQNLENTIDQINASMETLQVDIHQQQSNLELQLQQPLPHPWRHSPLYSNHLLEPLVQNTQPAHPQSITTRPTTSHETDDPLAGGLRYFTPVSQNPGFQHLFVPARGRRELSGLRRLLIEKARFKKGSVIDLHFPNSSTIAILVHNDYAATALDLLRARGLEPIDKFDLYHPDNLGDPAFRDKYIEERTTKMKEIADNQYYTTIEGLAYKPKVQLAVARDFLRHNKITAQYIQDLLQRQNSPMAQSQPPKGDLLTLLTPEDDDMEESTQHHDTNNSLSTIMDATASSVHTSLTGDGEPAPAK
ncbi:hypothetical protein MAM1_0003c00275 [Mucor ambiguus]|uniref:Uncharacterized protein n=1 Tax=Mucor ambiguus TaxID=91626 RepID=A0A0C9LZR5_9FUNG|nr:hypothetical protein MAM1_0003c00275 [Mucor ambiguus]